MKLKDGWNKELVKECSVVGEDGKYDLKAVLFCELFEREIAEVQSWYADDSREREVRATAAVALRSVVHYAGLMEEYAALRDKWLNRWREKI